MAPRQRVDDGLTGFRVTETLPADSRATDARLSAADLARQRRSRRNARIATTLRGGAPVEGRRFTARQVPFVAVLVALLAAGLAGVLWLNTLTDEAGIRTNEAKTGSADLQLQIEALESDIAVKSATPAIAAAARSLGLVPAGDAAILVVPTDGSAAAVVGEPKPVADPAADAAKAAADAAAAAAAQAAAAAAAKATADAAADAAAKATADAAAQTAAQAASQQAAPEAAPPSVPQSADTVAPPTAGTVATGVTAGQPADTAVPSDTGPVPSDAATAAVATIPTTPADAAVNTPGAAG